MNTRAARTEFLRKGGYGFFYHFHYREQWLNPEEERLADDYYRICRDWNKVVENFDVEETARLLHSWNAGFFYLTIGQNAGYYCAPNSVYDRITGRSGKDSLCSRRDLISDLADALKKYEIPLIVYTTSNSPARCPEISRKLHFCKRNPDPEFIRLWSEIHREWAERWGKKSPDGGSTEAPESHRTCSSEKGGTERKRRNGRSTPCSGMRFGQEIRPRRSHGTFRRRWNRTMKRITPLVNSIGTTGSHSASRTVLSRKTVSSIISWPSSGRTGAGCRSPWMRKPW